MQQPRSSNHGAAKTQHPFCGDTRRETDDDCRSPPVLQRCIVGHIPRRLLGHLLAIVVHVEVQRAIAELTLADLVGVIAGLQNKRAVTWFLTGGRGGLAGRGGSAIVEGLRLVTQPRRLSAAPYAAYGLCSSNLPLSEEVFDSSTNSVETFARGQHADVPIWTLHLHAFRFLKFRLSHRWAT